MSSQLASNRLTTHYHRLVILISYLLIIAVVLRRRYDLVEGLRIGHLLILVGFFAALFASEPFLSRKLKKYQRIYFVLQVIIVQLLGLFQSYQDTWALLFIVLGFQVAVRCTRKEAIAWFSLFATSLLVTLCFEFGLISGLGRALAYIVIGFLLISYDIQYAQNEDALSESRMLLAELQEAHQKLAEYAFQAETLAAAQERNRIIQELYDSVGQKIFAIQLAAEAARLLLGKNPRQASEQIGMLKEQTKAALIQMRQLIGQWRPG